MEKLIYFLAIVICYANGNPLDGSLRIINGGLAAENQFPYAISLQLRQIGVAQPVATRGHKCGGVLITLQHALTTATCVLTTGANGTIVPINPTEYRVFAGSVSLNNDSVADRIRDIANFTIHPNYISFPALVNDIAVITLTTPFPATAVQPISLPAADFDPADNTLCTVAGWGTDNVTDSTPASTQLRYASKYIFNQNICTLIYNSAGASNPNVLPSMMCAASLDIISAGCTGDFGNGLVCNETLSGILFANQGCAPTGRPELYTKVSQYTEWIRSITGSASTFAPGVFTLLLLTILQFFNSKIFA